MKIAFGLFAVVATAWFAPTASAALTTFASYTGNVGVSVDAGGSTASTLPDGLTASIPVGSSVIAAYLYTSTYDISIPTNTAFTQAEAGGTFNGNTVTYTALEANPSADLALQAGVANVTSIVASEVGSVSSSTTPYNFTVTESNTSEQDGEVLVVVYSNPSLPTASVGILSGAASSIGDTATINFSSNPSGDPVYLSVGDGFSYDLGGVTDQFSTITVDGSLLTAAAGNCDQSQDGGTPPNATNCANGDLITAGVLGLNANGTVNTSYSNPFTTIGDTNTATDHELYNITSLINPADGNIVTTTTMNTSLDDNIFEEVYYVQGAVVSFNTPEPSTAGLVGIGLLSGIVFLRVFRRAQARKLSR